MNKAIILTLILISAMVIIGCEERKVVNIPGEIPAVPTGVTSITGDGQVTVQWRGNNDNNLTEGYGVYRYKQTVNGVDQYERIGQVGAGNYKEVDDVLWYEFIDVNVTNGNTYYYSVSAYNQFGESELSALDAQDTPRPDGSATLRDYHQFPGSAGFDFSTQHIVNWESTNADIYFEFDPDPAFNTFFVYVANSDIDIQDYGVTSDLHDVGWGDPGGGKGWSSLGYMELINGHSYIVWTADDHYATFRVESTDKTSDQLTISIKWAYQTDPGNPELKRRPVERPQHDANYGRRDGR